MGGGGGNGWMDAYEIALGLLTLQILNWLIAMN